MHGNGIYTYGSTGKQFNVVYERNTCKSKTPVGEGEPATTPAEPAATAGGGGKTFPEWLVKIDGIDDDDRAIFVEQKIDEATFLSLSSDDIKVCG